MAENSPLFIEDNSDENWKGLCYLADWTEIADAFDVANRFFEIGAGAGQREARPQVLDGNQPMKHFTHRAISGRLTPTRRGAYSLFTSLPTVSTAGRGAVPSGAAPAFFWTEEVTA